MPAGKARRQYSDQTLGRLVLLAWTAYAIVLFGFAWHDDMSAIYFAAFFYAEGNLDAVYTSPERFFGSDWPAIWTETLKRLGYEDQYIFAYIYPPIWAALLAPIAIRVDPYSFFAATFFVHAVMIAASVALTWRIAGKPIAFLTWCLASLALVSFTAIGVQSMQQNQVQITVTFCTVLFLLQLIRGRDLQAGAWLGLAAALKLSPLVLVALLLVERRWRAIGGFLSVSGGLALASVLVTGWPLHEAFLERLSVLSESVLLTEINYSLKALAIMALNAPEFAITRFTENMGVATSPAWLNLAMPIILIGMVALAVLLTRRFSNTERLVRSTAAISIAIALTGPVSWAHHFFLPMILLPCLLAYVSPRQAWTLFGAALLVFSVPTLLLLRLYSADGFANLTLSVLAWLALYAAFLIPGRPAAAPP